MGDPVANSDLYIERSAVTFASNLRAKVLIMHGLNDPLCPISQARGLPRRLLVGLHDHAGAYSCGS